MRRLIISCLLFVTHFSVLFAFEKSLILENSSKGTLILEPVKVNQKIDVQSYSLENISTSPIKGIFLSINGNRQTQKEQLCQQLLEKNNLWKWVSLNHIALEKQGAYSWLIGSALQIPSREVPTFGDHLREFYFENKWHLIDDKKNLIYLSLDNHTIAGYEDIADEPFLALRTKTSASEESYHLAQACANFARFNIFPRDFDCFEPSPEEQLLNWNDYQFDLFPNEKIIFHSDGTVEQTFHLAKRICSPGSLHIETGFPIIKIVNYSQSVVELENENFFIEPLQSYDLQDPLFSFDLNVNDCQGSLKVISKVNQLSYWNLGTNEIDLGLERNPGTAHLIVNYELNENFLNDIPISIVNSSNYFDHKIPFFELECKEMPEKISWQISFDRDFDLLISNLQGIQDFTQTLQLDVCSDTFINPYETYYFRVKGLFRGKWNDWSPVFEFSASKPAQVLPVFKKLDNDKFQISWEPSADADTQYLVFASNAYDFMPAIYTCQQFSVIDQDEIESEQINNLIARTSECSINIGTEYPFYRVIAEKNASYSIPSPIVRVYDYSLSIPRNVMQAVLGSTKRVERMAFPAPYAHIYEQDSLKIQSYALDLEHLQKSYYTYPAHVDPMVWSYMKPYFLPENHPVKSKLDRLFSKRVTENIDTLEKAGFTSPTPMKFSKTIVSKNKQVPGYMFKFFADSQKGISDWKHLQRRVTGSIYIQEALNKYNLNHLFVVPTKYIYPLPSHPAPSSHLERKNFVLIENALDIYTGKENNSMWKSPIINPITLTWTYILLSEIGLSDSAYSFNMPINRDNRISFIDTEHHHKWPVPFYKLWPYLSPEMGEFWNRLCTKGWP